eukprot:631017-Pyramimonas_sp.AAC.1
MVGRADVGRKAGAQEVLFALYCRCISRPDDSTHPIPTRCLLWSSLRRAIIPLVRLLFLLVGHLLLVRSPWGALVAS